MSSTDAAMLMFAIRQNWTNIMQVWTLKKNFYWLETEETVTDKLYSLD